MKMKVKYNEGFGWSEDEIPTSELEAWASEMGENNDKFEYCVVTE
jgi:hypothetical protein